MTKSPDIRPAWNHKLSEEKCRWLAVGRINKITHHSELTDVDKSEEWIEIHRGAEKRKFETNFLNLNGYFEFRPSWSSLVEPTYLGKEAIKTIEAIDAFEKRNTSERREYERLKRKFES